MIGTTLGHYNITGKLGHGGMGEVFRAEDTKLKRQVALKVLPQDLSGDDDRLARFQREAEMVAALNHPNIVTLFSVEEDNGVHFLTMELVDGKSLDGMIPSIGLGLQQIFDIAIPMADALSTAHERGIIHRDLKPANVMVNSDGRVKVLDFGLAKLAAGDEASGEDDATEALTQEGKVLGTVPYMSPEQVQGKALDARSDVFSLGIMIYEMATGDRPFAGETSADLISSILRDNPSSVTELKGELPHHLGRVVRHCMEKDPKRRYQSALDVRNELEDLQREIQTGAVHSETIQIEAQSAGEDEPGANGRGFKWAPAAIVAAAVLAIGFLGWKMLAPGDSTIPIATPTSAVATDPSEPSIAVLYFDNLSGDEELDWLRSGLTDMLVTDLSQSPDLRVLSTDRLYTILADMKKLDERITSFEVVREVAEEANADTVILGSFAKLGDTIRISIKVQEAATGEILKSESVNASVQEDIFARVDDLSRNIRQSIELPDQPSMVADRDLTEVSTASIEAYKAFVEAEELHYQTREQEALELYKKATEIDPEFAMAWAKLATAHGNLGMVDEARQHAEKAMEHLDRLTEVEQAYVEGRYYGQKLDTIPRAIETYEKALANYPYATSLLNNVGVLYGQLNMYGEQIAAYEKAIAYGDVFPGTHTALAGAYMSTGDTDRAFEVLDEFLAETPTSVSAYQTLTNLHLAMGDVEAAKASLAKSEELRPGFFGLIFDRLAIAVLEEDWDSARAAVAEVGALPFPFAKPTQSGISAMLALYRGQTAEALEHGHSSIEGSAPGSAKAQALVNMAAAYLEMDEPEQALELAQQAQTEDPGNMVEFIGHGFEIIALQQIGQNRRADLLLDELEQRLEPIPGPGIEGWLHEIRGSLALERGQADAAVAEFEKAANVWDLYSGREADVWFKLGEAYQAAGRDREAEDRFRAVTQLAGTRVFDAPNFIASHYELGQLLEARGDEAGARAAYEKYLSYWQDADRFREDVDHAAAFVVGR